MMGAGSASPVVSRTIWSNRPFFSMRLRIAVRPVSRTEQHRQPLLSSSHSSTRASSDCTEMALAVERQREGKVSEEDEVGETAGSRRAREGRRTLDIARVAKLVHDDGDAAAVLLFEDVVEEGALARAEVACDDGHGHLGRRLDQLWAVNRSVSKRSYNTYSRTGGSEAAWGLS